jgi:hypothetical protein
MYMYYGAHHRSCGGSSHVWISCDSLNLPLYSPQWFPPEVSYSCMVKISDNSAFYLWGFLLMSVLVQLFIFIESHHRKLCEIRPINLRTECSNQIQIMHSWIALIMRKWTMKLWDIYAFIVFQLKISIFRLEHFPLWFAHWIGAWT